MLVKCAVWAGLGVYALLSATDWAFTFALLRAHPGAVEANPLAAACLERYGWDGLMLYKAGGVLVFVGAIFLLARRRPVVAATVTAAGCAILLVVTVYTHGLLCEAHREARECAEDAAWPKANPAARPAAAAVSVPDRCWFTPEPVPAPTAVVSRR